MPEPPRSRLRALLEHPRARAPVTRAVVGLLAVALVSVGALGALVVWHLLRRGRLIRDRLGPPRDTLLSSLETEETNPRRPPDGATSA